MNTDRINRLHKRVVIDSYPICIEKYRITLDVLEKNKNESVIIQRAKMMEACVERMPISISEDELIVGIAASKPMGIEIDPSYGIWPQDEIDSLKEDGFIIDPQDEIDLQLLNEKHNPITLISEESKVFYEYPRIISLLKAGVALPPWKDKSQGMGVRGGYAQSGLGVGPCLTLEAADFTPVIKYGTDELAARVKKQMDALTFYEADAMQRMENWQAMQIALNALGRLGQRYSELASEMAKTEKDEKRKKELEEIAAICAQVPKKPARSFREAMQCLWFIMIMLSPDTTLAGLHYDQYMYPYYRHDIDNGLITDDEVLELLCCLRFKDMELNRISGRDNRKKNSGMAKWHNFVIGGVDKDGNDVTNELSYLILESIKLAGVPHHTVTIRVHKDTPKELLIKGLEVVKCGFGMPAFVGDPSYLSTMTNWGAKLEDAREYVISGCLDPNIPGRSRTGPQPHVVVPLIFDIFRHNGYSTRTGELCGIQTGEFTSFASFEEMMSAWRRQLDYCLGIICERNNVELMVDRKFLPDPLRSALMDGGIETGLLAFDRRMPYENSSSINCIGVTNVGNSMAAVKKLVFDEKKYTLKELYDALEADWVGYEEMRSDFINAPKFGNGDPFVDEIVARCYEDFATITYSHKTIFGAGTIPSGISITSHMPGGQLTGATPDGRKAGSVLADGSMSPMRGTDVSGPTAVLTSAMRVNQDLLQATLLNMKFSPNSLKTESDLEKLASLIKTYLTNGGKHLQFNVVDRKTLENAKADPASHRELIVRVAGYSTYFVQLNKQMQEELIERQEHVL